MQPILDFRPPLVPMPTVPHRGETPLARAASVSGAQAARATFGAKQRKLLLWLARGPMSRQGLSEATGISINAVCSSLAALLEAGAVVSNGDQEIASVGGKQTRRERFRLKG